MLWKRILQSYLSYSPAPGQKPTLPYRLLPVVRPEVLGPRGCVHEEWGKDQFSWLSAVIYCRTQWFHILGGMKSPFANVSHRRRSSGSGRSPPQGDMEVARPSRWILPPNPPGHPASLSEGAPVPRSSQFSLVSGSKPHPSDFRAVGPDPIDPISAFSSAPPEPAVGSPGRASLLPTASADKQLPPCFLCLAFPPH